MAQERLQKILAAAGVASRRKSEELITQGRVEVNGQIVSELGAKADQDADHIKVDGKSLRGPERKRVLMLNKPKGYVSTTSDPEHRATVMDLLKEGKRSAGTDAARLYPVGRLDYHSEGLLLLTNDGDLAEQLTRASSHVPKVYLVKIAGKPDEGALDRLRRGVKLAPRPIFDSAGKQIPGKSEPGVTTAPARIEIFKDAENPWYEVTLIEGRNRQIRRMFEEVGHHVEKIKRVKYGPLELNVMPGEFRELTNDEIDKLRRAPRQKLPGGSRRPPERDRSDRRAISGERGEKRTFAKREFRGREKREGSREQRFGGREERAGGREQRFGGREQRAGGREQRFGGRGSEDRGGREERFRPEQREDRGTNRRDRREAGAQGRAERFASGGQRRLGGDAREQGGRGGKSFGDRRERSDNAGRGQGFGARAERPGNRGARPFGGRGQQSGGDERGQRFARGGREGDSSSGQRSERGRRFESQQRFGGEQRGRGEKRFDRGARGQQSGGEQRFGGNRRERPSNERGQQRFGGERREQSGRGEKRFESRGRNERDQGRGQRQHDRNDNRGQNRGATKRPRRG